MYRQKFRRGHRVRIADTLQKNMEHFRSSMDAIIIGSYADRCGALSPNSFNIYSLALLDDQDRVVDHSSWYPADSLTLINADRDAGEDILQTANEARFKGR